MIRFSSYRILALALLATSSGYALAQSSLTNSNSAPWAEVDVPYIYAYRTGSSTQPATYPVSTNRPDVVNLPSSITIPSGAGSNLFYYSTNPVTADTPVRINVGFLHEDIIVKHVGVTGHSSSSTTFFGHTTGHWHYVNLPCNGKVGGFNVQMTSSRPDVIPVEPTINVPQGALSNFQYFSANEVAVDTSVRITARLNGQQRQWDYVVKPSFTQPLAPNVTEVVGGSNTVAWVYANLNTSPRSAYRVNLTSSDPAALPIASSVDISPGSLSNFVYLGHQPVSSPKLVTLTGKSDLLGAGAPARTAQILVEPNTPSIDASSTTVLGGTENPYHYVRVLAPLGAATDFPLTSSAPEALAVPEKLSVASGSSSNWFYSTSKLTPIDRVVTLSTQYAGMPASVNVTVLANKPTHFAFVPQTVPQNSGGHYYYLYLRGNAPSGGASVALSSDNPGVLDPGGPMAIIAGSNNNWRYFSVGSVTRPTYVTLSATWNQNTAKGTVAVVPPVNRISGRIFWNGLADPATAPETVDLEFRQGATTVMRNNVPLHEDLSYNVAAPGGGNWDVSMKAGTWLRRTIKNISDGRTFADFNLINGDIDDDNAVTVFDYIELSAAFDTFAGDPGFNERADLDRDGSVSVFDYIILSENFDTEGDQ